MFTPVYFDHNASTPIDARVLAGMQPFMTQQYGNASSRHEYGRAARRAIDEARQRVAYAVGAHPTEIVFTSGGSEANNLFIKGTAANLPAGGIAISTIEHPCVREPAKQLVKTGWKLQRLEVDGDGLIRRVASTNWQRAPSIVSAMLANNETGAVQDIVQIAQLAKACGALMHTDAVQGLGKMPIDFRALNSAGVSAMTLSAHKIGGPKGAGVLVLDKRVDLQPLIAGGGHERGLRSGTENVAAIVGFGLAAEYAVTELPARRTQLVGLRDALESGLKRLDAIIFSQKVERLPNTSYFAFEHIDGETLVAKLDRAGFAVASGAACSSANPEPSAVLLAMGVPAHIARGAVRVSFGAGNTQMQVDDFLLALTSTLAELRGLVAVAH